LLDKKFLHRFTILLPVRADDSIEIGLASIIKAKVSSNEFTELFTFFEGFNCLDSLASFLHDVFPNSITDWKQNAPRNDVTTPMPKCLEAERVSNAQLRKKSKQEVEKHRSVQPYRTSVVHANVGNQILRHIFGFSKRNHARHFARYCSK